MFKVCNIESNNKISYKIMHINFYMCNNYLYLTVDEKLWLNMKIQEDE